MIKSTHNTSILSSKYFKSRSEIAYTSDQCVKLLSSFSSFVESLSRPVLLSIIKTHSQFLIDQSKYAWDECMKGNPPPSVPSKQSISSPKSEEEIDSFSDQSSHHSGSSTHDCPINASQIFPDALHSHPSSRVPIVDEEDDLDPCYVDESQSHTTPTRTFSLSSSYRSSSPLFPSSHDQSSPSPIFPSNNTNNNNNITLHEQTVGPSSPSSSPRSDVSSIDADQTRIAVQYKADGIGKNKNTTTNPPSVSSPTKEFDVGDDPIPSIVPSMVPLDPSQPMEKSYVSLSSILSALPPYLNRFCVSFSTSNSERCPICYLPGVECSHGRISQFIFHQCGQKPEDYKLSLMKQSFPANSKQRDYEDERLSRSQFSQHMPPIPKARPSDVDTKQTMRVHSSSIFPASASSCSIFRQSSTSCAGIDSIHLGTTEHQSGDLYLRDEEEEEVQCGTIQQSPSLPCFPTPSSVADMDGTSFSLNKSSRNGGNIITVGGGQDLSLLSEDDQQRDSIVQIDMDSSKNRIFREEEEEEGDSSSPKSTTQPLFGAPVVHSIHPIFPQYTVHSHSHATGKEEEGHGEECVAVHSAVNSVPQGIMFGLGQYSTVSCSSTVHVDTPPSSSSHHHDCLSHSSPFLGADACTTPLLTRDTTRSCSASTRISPGLDDEDQLQAPLSTSTSVSTGLDEYSDTIMNNIEDSEVSSREDFPYSCGRGYGGPKSSAFEDAAIAMALSSIPSLETPSNTFSVRSESSLPHLNVMHKSISSTVSMHAQFYHILHEYYPGTLDYKFPNTLCVDDISDWILGTPPSLSSLTSHGHQYQCRHHKSDCHAHLFIDSASEGEKESDQLFEYSWNDSFSISYCGKRRGRLSCSRPSIVGIDHIARKHSAIGVDIGYSGGGGISPNDSFNHHPPPSLSSSSCGSKFKSSAYQPYSHSPFCFIPASFSSNMMNVCVGVSVFVASRLSLLLRQREYTKSQCLSMKRPGEVGLILHYDIIIDCLYYLEKETVKIFPVGSTLLAEQAMICSSQAFPWWSNTYFDPYQYLSALNDVKIRELLTL
eukprot:gnl/Carplike_NY0171/2681_a3602_251.p1 GENE.gnl/Carplike_NY0171/2681_a3602_251~~gnl/Carplike_NY0171/2681_a3602_251.p1  ORF type:complete len:1065 (-),score=219.65 gnl/Carplike_NY0171/2681_a3602_251:233-3373(-)